MSYAAPLMYRPQRRFFSWMTAVATLCCVAPVALGVPGVGLALTPVLLLAGLLLCGRYVGERRILAIRRALLRARRAPRRLPRPAPGRPLVSLLARRARVERGPPRPLAVTI